MANGQSFASGALTLWQRLEKTGGGLSGDGPLTGGPIASAADLAPVSGVFASVWAVGSVLTTASANIQLPAVTANVSAAAPCAGAALAAGAPISALLVGAAPASGSIEIAASATIVARSQKRRRAAALLPF